MYPHHLHQGRCFPGEVTRRPHQGKQIIEIILLRQELMFDIIAGIHQIEKARKPEEPKLFTDEDMEKQLLARNIDTAINEVVSRCQAYLLLPSPFAHRHTTDHAYGWEEKSIYLAMPMKWPPHCIDVLRDACHNYIVERATALFLAKPAPQNAQVCTAIADTHYDEICAQLSHRLGRIDIQPTWLG